MKKLSFLILIVLPLSNLAADSPMQRFLKLCQQPTGSQRHTLEAMAEEIKQTYTPENCQALGKHYRYRTRLVIREEALTDLTPFVVMEYLEYLSIPQNEIRDLTPLSALRKLRILFVQGNRIQDIRPLASLKKLESLIIGENNIANLSPLSGLTELYKLKIRDNRSPLDLQPLTRLLKLNNLATGNSLLKSLKPLAGLTKLTYLSILDPDLQDITPLSGLVNLHMLSLGSRKIEDFSPLSELVNLKSLDLSRSHIADLSPLAQLSNLESLSLYATRVYDLTPLKNLSKLNDLAPRNFPLLAPCSPKNLEELKSGKKGCDFSDTKGYPPSFALNPTPAQRKSLDILSQRLGIPWQEDLGSRLYEAIGQMRTLDISNSGLQNLEILRGQHSLRHLNLSGNSLSSLRTLPELPMLENLDLSHNKLADLSGIERLVLLEVLNLEHNPLPHVKQLLPLKALRELRLHGTGVSIDIYALRDMRPLHKLYLGGSVTDIRGVGGSGGIRYLTLNDTQIGSNNLWDTFIRIINFDPNAIDLSQVNVSHYLKQITIEHHHFDDMARLVELKGVYELSLINKGEEVPLRNLSLLAEGVHLDSLTLIGYTLNNFAALQKLVQLKKLTLHSKHLTDLSPLRPLTALTELDVKTEYLLSCSPQNLDELRHSNKSCETTEAHRKFRGHIGFAPVLQEITPRG